MDAYKDKRAYSGTNTTIINLKVDGNDKSGSTIDIKSRVNFENIEIYDVIHDNANGMAFWCMTNQVCMVNWYLTMSTYIILLVLIATVLRGYPQNGSWLFGKRTGNTLHSTQIVYKNSDLYGILGRGRRGN